MKRYNHFSFFEDILHESWFPLFEVLINWWYYTEPFQAEDLDSRNSAWGRRDFWIHYVPGWFLYPYKSFEWLHNTWICDLIVYELLNLICVSMAADWRFMGWLLVDWELASWWRCVFRRDGLLIQLPWASFPFQIIDIPSVRSYT